MTNKKRFTISIVCLIMLIMSMLVFSACNNKVENFNLYFKVDEENYATISTNGQEIVAIPEDPTKTGYEFDGWYWDKDEWNKPFTANSLLDAPISSNMSVYAKWNPISYTATFYADGTQVGTSSFTIEDTSIANAPDVPHKDGYEGVWTYEIKAENISVNAVYTPLMYSISYDNTKGATNNNVTEYNIEQSIELNELALSGYTFLGWFDGNTKIDEINVGNFGNITLTAKWELTEYTATFMADGKEIGKTTFTIEDTKLTNVPTVPAKNGYQATWEKYTISANNLIINAVYSEKGYTISYTNTKGVQNNNPTTYTIEGGALLQDLACEGYNFSGWYISGEKVEQVVVGSYGDLTIEARWMPVEYSINYENTKDANNPNPNKHTVETNEIVLADIKVTGFKFDGWYDENGEKITSIAANTMGEITLTARWTEIFLNEIRYDQITAISINDELSAELLNAQCLDNFETSAIIRISATPSNYQAGDVISLTIVAEHEGKTKQVVLENIKVYGIPSITYDEDVKHINGKASLTKLWFGITAKDTFDEDASVSITSEFELTAGEKTNIIITAVDCVGNKNTVTVKDIAIYGTPTLICNKGYYAFYENEQIAVDDLFTAYDSFGNIIEDVTTLTGDLIVGETIKVEVAATDAYGNTCVFSYDFAVLAETTPCVELKNGNEITTIFIEDGQNYTLPVPSVDENTIFYGWKDKASSTYYTYADGVGVREITGFVQLVAVTYDKGMTPIATYSDFNNMDLNGKYVLVNDISLNSFTPIGTANAPFTGVFDGNGFSITYYYVSGEVQYAGLFGYNQGIIKNVNLTNFSINTKSINDWYNSYSLYAGGIVGYNGNQGVIYNCYVTGGYINKVDALQGGGCYAGGIAGYNLGIIGQCYTNINIVGKSVYASNGNGGSRCTGTYMGGIVGYSNGIVTNCGSDSTLNGTGNNQHCDVGGLIGYNVGVVSQCYATGSVYSNGTSGGFAGTNEGEIELCYSTGRTEGNYNVGGFVGYNTAIINSCYSTSDVVNTSSSSSRAGGFVGECYGGTITQCYATGDVNNLYSYAGGFAGYNKATLIENCYASGNVIGEEGAGGFIGWSGSGTGSIKNCYAFGNVEAKGNDEYSHFAGGFVARSEGGSYENCYASGNVSSSGNKADYVWVGGFAATVSSSTLTNCYYYSAQEYKITVSGLVTSTEQRSRLNSDTKLIGTETSDIYSVDKLDDDFSWKIRITSTEKYFEQNQSANLDNKKTIEINSVADFLRLQGAVLSDNYVLNCDIDLNGAEWTPMLLFGEFDGNGHKIYNFKITEELSHLGLFSINVGTIKNLTVSNVLIEYEKTGLRNSDRLNAGIVVGLNYGAIVNCKIESSDILVTAKGRGIDTYIGGVCGINYGDISYCDITDVTLTNKTTNTGTFNNTPDYVFAYAGGICGGNSNGHITFCSISDVQVSASGSSSFVGAFSGYNDGYIELSKASNVQNDGRSSIYGDAMIGGAVGHNTADGTIINCSVELISTTALSGGDTSAWVGGFVGYNEGIIKECTISNLVFAANIDTSYSSYYGGFVGYNKGTITDSKVNSGKMECFSYYIGAFAGYNHASGVISGSCVENIELTITGTTEAYCKNHIGGFIGSNYGNVSNCFAANVSIIEEQKSSYFSPIFGGFVAYNDGTISDSYANTNIEFTGGTVGSFVGSMTANSTISGCVSINDIFNINNTALTTGIYGASADGCRINKCVEFVPSTGETGICNQHGFTNYTVNYSDLTSANFYSTIMCWSDQLWNFVDGSTPTLIKCVHNHDYSAGWDTDDSHHWQECTGCNNIINKNEHQWNDGVVTTYPTEAYEGIKTYTCKDCGKTRTESLEKLDAGHTHEFNKQYVQETYLISEATCSSKAIYYYSCSCGLKGSETFEHGEIDQDAHFYADWIYESDSACVSYCQYDSEHAIRQNHIGGQASCTEKRICENCGNQYGNFADHQYKNTWSSNTEQHWHECKNPDCDSVSGLSNHSFVDSMCECGEIELIEITSISQLKNMDMNGHYKLMCDLDFKNTTWSPLGTYSSPFTGVFDGNGYKISNLSVTAINTKGYEGIFISYNKGTIRNLTIENVKVTTTTTLTQLTLGGSGVWYVGGLVGENRGTIHNCDISGTINITYELRYNYNGEPCSTYGNGSIYVGGLVARNMGTVSECSSTVSVAVSLKVNAAHYSITSCGSDVYAGGLIGYNSGTVTNCYATGSVTGTSNASDYADNGSSRAEVNVGGLIGEDYNGTITNCYATGNVTATAYSSYDFNTQSYAGGLIGSGSGTMNNCFATGTVRSTSEQYARAGGLAGTGYTVSDAINCYRLDSQTITASGASTSKLTTGTTATESELKNSTFVKDTLGWAEDIWNFTDDNYPTLK